MNKAKLLMVEDDPRTITLCELILKKVDCFDLVTATNGLEALEKLKGEFIPIIVTDIMMPQMDGFRLIEEVKNSRDIRRKENIDHIIIVISALNREDDIKRAITLGAYDVIPKPLNSELFLAKMVNYYRLHTLMEEAEKRYLKINTLNDEIIEGYENRELENQALNEAIQRQKDTYKKQVDIIATIRSLTGSAPSPAGEEILKQCELFLDMDDLGK